MSFRNAKRTSSRKCMDPSNYDMRDLYHLEQTTLMSMLLSLAVALSGILNVICCEPILIITCDTIQFLCPNRGVPVRNSILHAFSPLWCSLRRASWDCGRSRAATNQITIMALSGFHRTSTRVLYIPGCPNPCGLLV